MALATTSTKNYCRCNILSITTASRHAHHCSPPLQAFQKLDSGSDGFLSVEDLKSACVELKLKLSQRDIQVGQPSPAPFCALIL